MTNTLASTYYIVSALENAYNENTYDKLSNFSYEKKKMRCTQIKMIDFFLFTCLETFSLCTKKYFVCYILCVIYCWY